MKETIRKIQSKIYNLFARGMVLLVDTENKPYQEIQASLTAGEVRSDIEHIQEYGFASKPLKDSECICMFFGGNRDNGLAIRVADERYRPKTLKSGEVMFYNNQGSYVHIDENKNINVFSETDIKAESNNTKHNIKANLTITIGEKMALTAPKIEISASSSVNLTSPFISTKGDLTHTGNITVTGDVVASGKSLVKHTHTGNGGSPTSPPS